MRFDLPTGWTSLGASPWTNQYQLTFVVDIDGSPHEVTLFQAPDTPIGFYLVASEERATTGR